jgi:hypothetical protein
MPTAERVVHQQIAPSSEASRKRKRRSGKKTLELSSDALPLKHNVLHAFTGNGRC